MGGVGGLATRTRDEWVCFLPLVGGGLQKVRGHSMTRVTADFPRLNTEAAVQAVKEDAPDNLELQNCRVPPLVGGEVDCLLGIKYQNLFPEIVHILPSGLAIYRSKIRAHDGVSNAVIGGCHEAFEHFVGIAGGVAPLLASFEASLRDLHDGHMPQISSIPISYEEIQAAKKQNLVKKAGEPETAQQVAAEANDDVEPAWGIADIVDITDEQDAQRGDILSPKMRSIGQDALCSIWIW